MAADTHNWSNDASDINNLNKLMGSQNSKEKQSIKDDKRFIDYFYPFVHTARIEQLYVMETTSNEPLPKNLVTAGERAEYIEIGVRYGFKEAAMFIGVYLVIVIIQFLSTIKYPSPDTSILSNGLWFAILISLIYGSAYTLHIAKFNVGQLTSKVITSLLAGRMIVVGIVAFAIGWITWGIESYIYANVDVVLLAADYMVPDKNSGFYEVIAGVFTILATPFGGPFTVTENSVAYAFTIAIPELFNTWGKIALAACLSVFIPLLAASFYKSAAYYRANKARIEFDNY